MDNLDPAALSFYTAPGLMTDPKEYGPLFASLPSAVPALCSVIQGMMLHIFWAERYGAKLSAERKQEVNIRPLDRKLARILELDKRALAVPRSLKKRLVGNCRDFALMLTAMLRYQGVPARARCGFGMYFTPDRGEDHWVCEYWNATEQRWVMADPQIDALQREALAIDFDPLDMPPGHFLPAGRVWQACRAGQDDPDRFGIFDMHGLWFVRGDLLRDLLALNKVEILPWDHWGLLSKKDEDLTADDWAFSDRAAGVTLDNSAFPDVRTLGADARVQPPADWAP